MDGIVLLESPSLRQQLCTEDNTAILKRVGSLITLPENGFAITEQVAEFYKASVEAIKQIVKRNRSELAEDGYRVLTRKEFSQIYSGPLHSQSRHFGIFPRRAVLRVGMLLVESEVAKQVRHYLLAAENHSLAIYEQHSLVEMAEQLRMHALKIAQNAHRSSDNADQLIHQANIIKAAVQEIYRDREELRNVRKKVDSLEFRFSIWENSSLPQQCSEKCISDQQIEILREKVRQLPDKPISIWKKFNKRFAITRYKFLPARNFAEALDWLERYGE